MIVSLLTCYCDLVSLTSRDINLPLTIFIFILFYNRGGGQVNNVFLQPTYNVPLTILAHDCVTMGIVDLALCLLVEVSSLHHVLCNLNYKPCRTCALQIEVSG